MDTVHTRWNLDNGIRGWGGVGGYGREMSAALFSPPPQHRLTRAPAGRLPPARRSGVCAQQNPVEGRRQGWQTPPPLRFPHGTVRRCAIARNTTIYLLIVLWLILHPAPIVTLHLRIPATVAGGYPVYSRSTRRIPRVLRSAERWRCWRCDLGCVYRM